MRGLHAIYVTTLGVEIVGKIVLPTKNMLARFGPTPSFSDHTFLTERMKRSRGGHTKVGLKERIEEAQAIVDALQSNCAHVERDSEFMRLKGGVLRAGNAMLDEAMKVWFFCRSHL